MRTTTDAPRTRSLLIATALRTSAVLTLAFAALWALPQGARAQTPNLADGLISHWHLDELSGTRSDSKGANHLSDNNAVTQVAGKLGQAAQFTRSKGAYLSIPHNQSLVPGTAGFTVAVWVYLNTNNEDVGIIGKSHAPEWGVVHYPAGYGAGSALRFMVRAAANNQIYEAVAGQLSAKAWHLVVAWHDPSAGTINLQVDGTAMSSAAFPAGGLRTDLADPLELGRHALYNYFCLNGSLDDVSLWGRALTAAERGELWNGGTGKEPAGGAPPPPTNNGGWQTSGANVYFSAGNVGMGIDSPAVRLHVVGNGRVTGNLAVDGDIAAKFQDVAEWVPSRQRLAAGTVVTLDTEGTNRVIASMRPYDTGVAGVVSARPGLALGEGGEGKVLVATTGRVKVKVDATRSPIKVGDLLVTSGVEGAAMRSVPVRVRGVRMHRPGTIVGKALEPLEKGVGEILVLLSLQ
ncbi:MAG TPA: LamG domain-containing protein [Pyrinomonadaceae bacterium]|jgi:hypothetical protein|nr:LamG domain-containing protein [Pyrinomonadaceae bacterium]